MKNFFLPRIIRTIIHGPPPCSNPITLTHRNIFVVPSRLGVVFFVTLLVLIFLGLNYRNNMVLLFCFILGCCAMISVIHSFLQLYGLRVEPGGVQDVFAGEFVLFEVFVWEDMGRKRYLEVECKGDSLYWTIEPWKRNRIFYRVKTQDRGRILSPRFDCISRYPLGLFRVWSVFRFSQQALVYPRPIPPPLDTPLSLVQLSDPGEGEGDEGRGVAELVYLDEYTEFDSYKKICWRLYARDGRLVKKVFAGDGTGVLWLSLEMFKEYPLEDAISFLCYLIIEAEAVSLRYGLALTGDKIPPSCGDKHMRNCLRHLALYGL